MSLKKKTKKSIKVSFTLSAREGEILAQYAKMFNTTRPALIHRFVREGLKSCPALPNPEPANQLGLFDSIQVDIFNNTTKTTDTID